MKRAYTKSIVINIGILMSILLMTNSVLAKMYRWTDKNGKVHYSQSIPPSQAQLGHSELDEKNGMTLTKVESSEIKKKKKEEKQKLQKKELKDKKTLREELMVYMFSSRQELIDHFEERLNMISVNIRLLQYNKKKLISNIEKVKNDINVVKNEKLKITLKRNLQESQSALIDHSRALESNNLERTEVSEQMARAIKTYDKKFGRTQLDVGSLVGESVLKEFRDKTGSSIRTAGASKEMCSCPCNAKNNTKNNANDTQEKLKSNIL